MDIKIQNIIKSQIDEIINQGFSFEIAKTELADNRFIEEIILEKSPIRIEISYNIFVDCKSVSLFLCRTDKNLSFSFEEYILYKLKDKKICRGAVDEADEVYINRFFKLFKEAINSDLMEVIKGNTWIDVPKDYSVIK